MAFKRVDEDGKDILFHWKFLSFGLKKALTKFQHIMDQVLKGLPFSWYYIDDVIIFSNTLEEYTQHLQQVFEKLQSWGFRPTSWKM